MKRLLSFMIVCLFGIGFLSQVGHASEGQLIMINKTNNQLAFFENGERVRTFSVGTGRNQKLTPEGTFRIVNKIKNRPYYKDKIPGGDPRNPLGDRWLGLNARGTPGNTYAVHGNSNPDSIGGYVSAGCVRMHDKEVRWLYDQVKVNTEVIILRSAQSFEQIAKSHGYDIAKPIEVFINGKELDTDQVPVLRSGRVLVPLRSIFEELGATVAWEEQSEKITASRNGTNISLTVGSTQAVVNGKEVILDVAARVRNGHTIVPVRFISEAFGATTSWDASKRVVDIHQQTVVKEPPVQEEIKIIINQQLKTFATKPYRLSGHTMVPLRGVFEELGAVVGWNEQTGAVRVTRRDTFIDIEPGSTAAFVNGEKVELDVPVEQNSDYTAVPLRFVSERLGVTVSWDEATKTIYMIH